VKPVVRIPKEVVSRNLGSETILLHLETGVYWSLNETGAAIWEEIAAHGNPAQTVRALQTRFPAQSDQLHDAVDTLLEHLEREGLVQRDGG
jgi:hypothetical protein